MRRCWLDVGLSAVMRVLVIGLLTVPFVSGSARAQDADPGAEDEKEPTLESQFDNYLHFAKVGRFDVADQMYGQPLVSRPELNPMTDEAADALVALTDKYQDSISMLQLLINNSTIGENASKLHTLIREAHKRQRMRPIRIKESIGLLAGDRVQQSVGVERLIESGEYAVPWLLAALSDPAQKELRPRIVRALKRMGRSAVNPLLAALPIQDDAIRYSIIEVLGKLGYPHAAPYLQRLAGDAKVGKAARKAAQAAIARIADGDPAVQVRPAAQLFYELAEQYYDNLDSLRPDPRDDRANVWYFRKAMRPGQDPVEPIEVPRGIFTLIMCMRCCEASLQLAPGQPEVAALWLAANFRREARLGLDVELEDTVDARSIDGTRPEKFARSIYFARCAGPSCCQIVLGRAIEDRDRGVALGAIAALSSTAGPQALVTPDSASGTSLAEALFFPDQLVRLKAALALGQAMPTDSFRGADEVVPVLASALAPTDKTYYLLVDPQDQVRQRTEEGLVATGATVVAGDRLGPALGRARDQLTHLDGIFLASDMERPTPIEAIRQLALDDRFALAPIVILIKPKETLILERIADLERAVGSVFVDAVDGVAVDKLLERRSRVAEKLGHREVSPEMKLGLALASARTLQAIATGGSGVFDVTVAGKTLVDTISTHDSEELRIAAASALAGLETASAQPAIAAVALDEGQTETLRMALFGELAKSARRFGSRLDGPTTARLVAQAFEGPNLALRTAASQALGAVNLSGDQAAKIIINQTRD